MMGQEKRDSVGTKVIMNCKLDTETGQHEQSSIAYFILTQLNLLETHVPEKREMALASGMAHVTQTTVAARPIVALRLAAAGKDQKVGAPTHSLNERDEGTSSSCLCSRRGRLVRAIADASRGGGLGRCGGCVEEIGGPMMACMG
uniref:Uncharacterized protein n=1 Tax=Parascaris univalens TaxID=6257 RepID=A0A915CLA9_PARUN